MSLRVCQSRLPHSTCVDVFIVQCRAVDPATLRDPQSDEERVKDPEWLVILGELIYWTYLCLNLFNKVFSVSETVFLVKKIVLI